MSDAEPLRKGKDKTIHTSLKDAILATATECENVTNVAADEATTFYALLKEKGVGEQHKSC